jgi:hypothetical protein
MTNIKVQMSNQSQNSDVKKYDLEEKTAPPESKQCRKLWKEAQELTLIVSSIIRK